MGRIAVFVIILIMYSALTFYLGWGIKIWLQSMALYPLPILYWSILYVIAFSFIFARMHEILRGFSVVGNFWLFIFQYGLLLVVGAHLLYTFTPYKNVQVLGAVLIGIFILLFIFGIYNAYTPVVRQLQFTVDSKSTEEKTIRFVIASDFHLGLFSNKKHLARFVTLANAAKPDVVLLAGDLVDDDPIWFVKHGMSDVMQQLQTTYGVYGIVGNHEYYGGKIPLLVEEMKEANVNILLDETIKIGDAFYLTGREDRTNTKRQTLDMLKPEDNSLPWIVMNHTPDDLHTPAYEGVDFHISGHTHKGQMWPNNYITNRIFELDYGYMQKKQMHTLVSSGFGFWGPPMRIGSQAELWVVDMHIK